MWTRRTRLSIKRSARLTGNRSQLDKYKRVRRFTAPSCSLHSVSGGLEGDDGDLGWAVEAQGEAYGANASVDVELHLVETEVALDVLLAERWEDEGADEGETDLAAVCVAREHQVDEVTAGMFYDVIRIIGLVGHKDDRTIGLLGYGKVEIGMAGVGVVGAA